MANWGNEHTQGVQSEMDASREKGINDGVDFIGYPLPLFCTKAVKELTAYEQGFILGWWLNRWIGETDDK